ncbi:hypothetical protein [Leptolyngbya sp. FACHB-261]|uniref:hypothetical protein n=1 Tax=Leptolyngbya sp. FACHB-261 TaxID=2692806 RepID=UPI001686FAC3|nr:hypothetical protein [Leptolyngbya sp. FACHB-261]MBD2103203.1 hypothetical protein [Leptolyngbya sp. FACHB-261]
MKERSDGFLAGVALGAAVGGVLGGLIGVVVGSRITKAGSEENLITEASSPELNGAAPQPRQVRPRRVEDPRRGLEDKIAQLNEAIDAVRDQLSSPTNPPKSDSTPENGGQYS